MKGDAVYLRGNLEPVQNMLVVHVYGIRPHWLRWCFIRASCSSGITYMQYVSSPRLATEAERRRRGGGGSVLSFQKEGRSFSL